MMVFLQIQHLWQKKMNTSSVQSSTLTAKTEKCTFTGKHSLQDTSSSGWQTATTSKTY